MATTDQRIRSTSSSSGSGSSTELASQLRFAVMRLSRRLRQHAPEDITPSQLSALSVIVRDGRLTLSQLAEAERVQPPTITRVVDSLEHKGLAVRIQSADDRRFAFVEPTAEGRALVDTIRKRRDAYLARRLRTFSPEDRALLERAAGLLERLIEDPER
jgi:DNA-binding MarR family transcriptional regulator